MDEGLSGEGLEMLGPCGLKVELANTRSPVVGQQQVLMEQPWL